MGDLEDLICRVGRGRWLCSWGAVESLALNASINHHARWGIFSSPKYFPDWESALATAASLQQAIRAPRLGFQQAV